MARPALRKRRQTLAAPAARPSWKVCVLCRWVWPRHKMSDGATTGVTAQHARHVLAQPARRDRAFVESSAQWLKFWGSSSGSGADQKLLIVRCRRPRSKPRSCFTLTSTCLIACVLLRVRHQQGLCLRALEVCSSADLSTGSLFMYVQDVATCSIFTAFRSCPETPALTEAVPLLFHVLSA